MQQEKLKTSMAVVTGKSGNKSIKVAIDYTVRHPKYGKVIRRRGKLGVHDEHNQASVGDVVEIAQGKPCSKTKKWRLVKIVKKAAIIEI
jgi:small subunit ribosomal protein S17